MLRREFLKWQLYSLLLCLMGPRFSWGGQAKGKGPDLVIIKGEVSRSVPLAIKELGGMERFVRPGSKVVIKPNMSFRNPPEMATTTSPEVLKAIVRLVLDQRPSSVKVLDNTLTDPKACLENSKIKEALKELACEVKVVKERAQYQEVKVKGRVLSSVEVMKEVLEADVLISVPVAKHHSSTGVSLSMKGLMGLIHDRSSFHYRYDLHKAIADLAGLLRPSLTLVDMTRALTTNGPSGPGDVLTLNTVVASTDMVAADAYVTSKVRWYGKEVSPYRVRHIQVAHEMGLGSAELQKMEILEKAI